MKTEFVSLKGRIKKNSSIIRFQVKNGLNSNSIGDQVWFNDDGETLEVNEHINEDTFEHLIDCFEHSHRSALRGALRKVGIKFD